MRWGSFRGKSKAHEGVQRNRGSRWNAAVAVKPHPFVTYETPGTRKCDPAASTAKKSNPIATANLPECGSNLGPTI